MNEEIESKLKEYVDLLNQIKEQVSNEDTAASIVSEIAKDRRVKQMQKNDNGNGSAATERQKEYMDKLGIDYPYNVTKREASQLIDEKLAEHGQQ